VTSGLRVVVTSGLRVVVTSGFEGCGFEVLGDFGFVLKDNHHLFLAIRKFPSVS